MQNKRVGEVFVIKTTDRTEGVKGLFKQVGLVEYAGKKVALKANYDSADPFPASTHPDTLRGIVEVLKSAAELGVGVQSAKEIKLKALNDEAKEDVKKIERVFAADG